MKTKIELCGKYVVLERYFHWIYIITATFRFVKIIHFRYIKEWPKILSIVFGATIMWPHVRKGFDMISCWIRVPFEFAFAIQDLISQLSTLADIRGCESSTEQSSDRSNIEPTHPSCTYWQSTCILTLFGIIHRNCFTFVHSKFRFKPLNGLIFSLFLYGHIFFFFFL